MAEAENKEAIHEACREGRRNPHLILPLLRS